MKRWLVLWMVALYSYSCDSLATAAGEAAPEPPSTSIAFPKIDRRPAPSDSGRRSIAAIPTYVSGKGFSVDLRNSDLSGLDLRNSLSNLAHACFDERTTWPAGARLPEGFDPARIMDLGKDPGLRIRDLHRQGVTGRGVGIAIIDQPLLTGHQEYADRLCLYEEIHVPESAVSQMHGCAVASIAVGKTVGVAPEADLYYIGSWAGDFGTEGFTYNFRYCARAIRRILQINTQLPADRKIRVISLSVGWGPGQKGYKAISEAAREAKAAGMLVVSSSLEQVHGFRFMGLGRAPLADPNDIGSYEPGAFWAKMFYESRDRHLVGYALLVPMGSRTTASQCGTDEYVFYREGGSSWAIPYIAGAYALAVQVEPDMTPDRFWALAMKTGRTIKLKHEDKTMPLGPILDPGRLIDAVKARELSDEAAVAAELAKHLMGGTTKGIQGVARGGIIEDFQKKVGLVNINQDGLDEIVRIFGEPTFYWWAGRKFEKDNLPDQYIAAYPPVFAVVMSHGHIHALRFAGPGYVFRDTIHFGSGLEDVLKVLGQPTETVHGKHDNGALRRLAEDPSEWKAGVLYKDINGTKGYCYYSRPDQGVRVFFADYRVTVIYLTRTESNSDRQTVEPTRPTDPSSAIRRRSE